MFFQHILITKRENGSIANDSQNDTYDRFPKWLLQSTSEGRTYSRRFKHMVNFVKQLQLVLGNKIKLNFT